MTGGITEMKNTPFRRYRHSRPPRQIQLERMQKVISQELTESQRKTLLAYHIQGKTVSQIAQERGVHKSTVSRTLRRAENRLRRFLAY